MKIILRTSWKPAVYIYITMHRRLQYAGRMIEGGAAPQDAWVATHVLLKCKCSQLWN